VNELRVIAITHKQFPLEVVARFHADPALRAEKLIGIKEALGASEIMYLSTCNRVEFIFTLPHYVCPGLTARVLSAFQGELPEEEIKRIAHSCERYNGPEAAEHLLRVASSLESLVIGEREIITQLRKAYEDCTEAGLTGDKLRLVIRQCIRTAKEIFTETDLSRKPVSVVSLAWQKFLDSGLDQEARILLIGAGQIITNFSKFLAENGYGNVTIANRSLGKAESLAQNFGFQSIALDQLHLHTSGFDALVSCTAAEHAVINEDMYMHLLQGEVNKKLVIDLALPHDIDRAILRHPVEYVDMLLVQQLASQNLSYREQALSDCIPLIESGTRELERSFNEREIERAMRSIPDTIKEIRNTAMGSVFARDLEQIDDHSRELLEKIISYMEKKYISIPMKMAREVLLDAVQKN
jgi:glutamyl-tRNA reductase